MKFIRCNRCKQEIRVDAGYYELSIRRNDEDAFSMSEPNCEGEADICPNCMIKVVDFINGVNAKYF